MYRIRTVCPTCQAIFGVEFTETGPLEEETYEKALGLCEELSSLRSAMTYNGVNIPESIQCPGCHLVSSRRKRNYSVYNAGTTHDPDIPRSTEGHVIGFCNVDP